MFRRLFEALAHFLIAPNLENRWEFWAFLLFLVVLLALAAHHDLLSF